MYLCIQKGERLTMKRIHFTFSLIMTVLVLTGCFSSKENVAITPTDPFKSTDKVTLNYRKTKKRDWQYPLEGGKVISPFGGKRPNHKGTDLKSKANDEVKAAFGGLVTYSGVMSGYGNVIFVQHPNGLETRYAHNSMNLVKKGDKVKAGDVLALEGKTGNATTEHVHFETLIGGHAFDSELLFDHKHHKLRKVKLQAKKRKGVVRVKAK